MTARSRSRRSALDELCDRLAAAPDDRVASALDTGAVSQSVSVLLASYNRCPFDPAAGRLRDNPLTWALDSLLAQHGNTLGEIVVVDDGSTDHTAAVLDHYQHTPTAVPVVVRRHRAHVGAFAARNAAIDAAQGKMLLFGDDDCVYPPLYACGAASLLTERLAVDPATCAITLPFYVRALRPRDVVALDQIGRLDRERARYTTNFDCYPSDYLPEPPRGVHGLLDPFLTQAVNGTCIFTAEALHQVGGFADLTGWRTSYPDHLYLAAALSDSGGHIYHCPDPRIGAAHLKFGATGRYQPHPADLAYPIPPLGRPFGELVALSAVARTATGCRVGPDEFLTEMIGSFFAFYLQLSRHGAREWALSTHRDFVQRGVIYTRAVADTPAVAERRRQWRAGLTRGARFAVATPPQVACARITDVLDEITETVGDAVIRPW